MGTYNYLRHLAECPACKKISNLEFQVHTASSLKGGRFKGELSFQTYQLGSTLPWMLPSEPKYYDWMRTSDNSEETLEVDSSRRTVRELVYGYCLSCKEELEAVLTIGNLKLEALEKIDIYNNGDTE